MPSGDEQFPGGSEPEIETTIWIKNVEMAFASLIKNLPHFGRSQYSQFSLFWSV